MIFSGWHSLRLFKRLGADPSHEITAGVGKFELHAFDQFGNGRGVRDLADTLSGTPDVAPRLDLHVAAGAEIHLRFVGDRQVVRVKASCRDRWAKVIAMKARE